VAAHGTGRARRWAAWRRALAGAALAAALVTVWGAWLEPASLRNDNYRLELPRWPAACAGLRVAVLADLHTGSPFNGVDKLERIVVLANKARPDLVLIAGDLGVDGVPGARFVAPAAIAARLARLEAPLGRYAVLGNHDWWYGAEKVRTALERAGIAVLDDRAVALARGACRFWLVGLGDLWEGRPDVQRAFADVPAGAAALALTHNPDLFPAIPARAALTVAGHTHGGQVALPLIGRPVLASRHKDRYAIGHVVERGRHLFVSPGLGTSILPVRFGVPPEISVLELQPRPAGGQAPDAPS
jgi:hypothetical protein